MSFGARPPQLLDSVPQHLSSNTLIEFCGRGDVGVSEVCRRDGLIYAGFRQAGPDCAADIVQRALLDLGLLQGPLELLVEVVVELASWAILLYEDVGLSNPPKTPLLQLRVRVSGPGNRPIPAGLALPRPRARDLTNAFLEVELGP